MPFADPGLGRRGGALWIAGLLTPFARATARDRTKRGGADAQANRREWAACRSSSEAEVKNPSRGARQRVEAHLVTLIPGFRPATTASQESGLTPENLPLSKRAKVAVERCGFFLRQSLRQYYGHQKRNWGSALFPWPWHESLRSKTHTVRRFTSFITRSMELEWIQDEFDGSWIAQGKLRRYRVYLRPDRWHAVCHSWSASWPRYDSQPVNVQGLATGVSLDEAKARCREHSNE